MTRLRLLVVAAAFAGATAALLFGSGEYLSRPAARSIGSPPPDFAAHTVHIPTATGQAVVGWFAEGSANGGAVLLLHGIRTDRTQMLGRARALNRLGYAVLLIDLPAHGESTGERITFGAQEAVGVATATAFLRSRLPGERLGVVGVSLGAASAVLATIEPPPDAVVLESMYPTIDEAAAARLEMRLGRAGAGLAPLLLWQLPLRTGVSLRELRPIERVASLRAPVLVASGAEDRHTTWSQTERLFQSARAPKELWRVEGAAHVDLHAHDPAAYERRVFAFLARYLRDGG